MESSSFCIKTYLIFNEWANKVSRQVLYIRTQTNITICTTAVDSVRLIVFL